MASGSVRLTLVVQASPLSPVVDHPAARRPRPWQPRWLQPAARRSIRFLSVATPAGGASSLLPLQAVRDPVHAEPEKHDASSGAAAATPAAASAPAAAPVGAD